MWQCQFELLFNRKAQVDLHIGCVGVHVDVFVESHSVCESCAVFWKPHVVHILVRHVDFLNLRGQVEKNVVNRLVDCLPWNHNKKL